MTEITTVSCTANAPFGEGTQILLTDTTSGLPQILPANCFVTECYVQAPLTLVGTGATISIGTAAATTLVASTLSLVNMNLGQIRLSVASPQVAATAASQFAIQAATATITAGQLVIIFKYRAAPVVTTPAPVAGADAGSCNIC